MRSSVLYPRLEGSVFVFSKAVFMFLRLGCRSATADAADTLTDSYDTADIETSSSEELFVGLYDISMKTGACKVEITVICWLRKVSDCLSTGEESSV